MAQAVCCRRLRPTASSTLSSDRVASDRTMIRVTNITRKVIEERLGLTPEQEKVLNTLHDVFNDVFKNGMGAKEIAVMVQDIGGTVSVEVHQWQPFAFAALYFDDELFAPFTNGDKHALEEATLPEKPLGRLESE